MRITFLGATQTVTGSKYLIQASQKKILIDCGLFQGKKELRLLNWQSLPIDASQIDYVLLTHAHIDHSGYLPILIKQGFKGKILCTEATRDLCTLLLPDSGHLHEEEARYANQKGYSKHHPALPLYTREDGEKTIEYITVMQTDKWYNLADNLNFKFQTAGHILGAVSIFLKHHQTRLFCTGDLGRKDDPILPAPKPPPKADYYLVESTYGNKLHPVNSVETELETIINRTVKRGGTILIPSFAVGRAQLVLYYIYQLIKQQRIPRLPVFINSPMATNATKLFYQHHKLHKLSNQQTANICNIATYVQSVEESIQLDANPMPKIIISASGMATGGRVLHHIKSLAPDYRNAIVFCGYQAAATRGEKMVNGATEIKMHGKYIPIKAEVINLDSLSAHADYQEILDYFKEIKSPPKQVFMIHGEQESARALKENFESELQWPCTIPSMNESILV